MEPLLRQALDDLAVPCPEESEAERWLLHHLAAQLADDRLAPVALAAALMHREVGAADDTEETLLVLLAQYCPCCCPDRWTAKEFRSWESDVRSAASALVASALAGPA